MAVAKSFGLAAVAAGSWWGIAGVEAGEKIRPRIETAADAVEYGRQAAGAEDRFVAGEAKPVRDSQVIQTAGTRPAPTTRGGRPPAVANNRGVVGKDPVDTVDPLEDPFADPFAEGVPSLQPPKVPPPVRTAPKTTTVRPQPVKRAPAPVAEADEAPVIQLPVIKSQPVAPKRSTAQAQPPAEVAEPPVLRSVPRNPPPANRSPLDEGYECPNPSNLKKIDQITPGIGVVGDLPTECSLGEELFAERNYCQLTYQWKASSLCSKPLYFEDEQLERYGRLRHPVLQPVISGGRFFVDCAIVPYKMGVDRPRDCVYALGYYRPGDCVPGFRKRIFPLDADGVVLEALFVGGLVALIP